MKKTILSIFLVFLIIGFFLKEGSGPEVSQNGISPSKLASDIFIKYDSNHNELLDVNSESFLRNTTDNVRKTESRGLLFTDVDEASDGNGQVTLQELNNFLEDYDTDGDGEITTFKNIIHSIFSTGNEWKLFDETYGERYKYEDLN